MEKRFSSRIRLAAVLLAFLCLAGAAEAGAQVIAGDSGSSLRLELPPPVPGP